MHERLKHNSRMHFDSLSLLKVESTVCFQRKRSTLTSCALNPRALISSLKQPNLNLYIYCFNKFDCP
ncbi:MULTISPECIES: hypothetical protein [Gardnerella]|uniref:hypothetical protein n=1 Tax=Gardnerella TaxID=2701 RepID=UPI0027DE58C1|nr:hypothetical protein [Gardnerella vaginalis]